MMKKQRDPNMPIGKLVPIVDDLPSPAELSKPLQAVKITIYLSKASVDYFKRSARKHHTKYQRMVREVVDNYVYRQHITAK